MLKKDNVFGVVIVFMPTPEVIKNISTYISEVSLLYIYDNSPSSNKELFSHFIKHNKAIYMSNGENDGISKALNTIASSLQFKKDSWLLTMDQDSSFSNGSCKALYETIYDDNYHLGIISPCHLTQKKYKGSQAEVYRTKIVMTSGNLVNLGALQAVGGFDERFFIDCVDWEFCLKLNQKGYDVIVNPLIGLEHGLGEPKQCKGIFKGERVIVLNHNPIRRYYITRNKLLLCEKFIFHYPAHCFLFLFGLFFSDLKSIFLYEDDKVNKLYYYMKGVKDYFLRNFGKLK